MYQRYNSVLEPSRDHDFEGHGKAVLSFCWERYKLVSIGTRQRRCSVMLSFDSFHRARVVLLQAQYPLSCARLGSKLLRRAAPPNLCTHDRSLNYESNLKNCYAPSRLCRQIFAIITHQANKCQITEISLVAWNPIRCGQRSRAQRLSCWLSPSRRTRKRWRTRRRRSRRKKAATASSIWKANLLFRPFTKKIDKKS